VPVNLFSYDLRIILRLHLIEIAKLHKKNNMGKLSPVLFYKCGGGNNSQHKNKAYRDIVIS
jgi:hypothetical protein